MKLLALSIIHVCLIFAEFAPYEHCLVAGVGGSGGILGIYLGSVFTYNTHTLPRLHTISA
jgi:hypothetical protein